MLFPLFPLPTYNLFTLSFILLFPHLTLATLSPTSNPHCSQIYGEPIEGECRRLAARLSFGWPGEGGSAKDSDNGVHLFLAPGGTYPFLGSGRSRASWASSRAPVELAKFAANGGCKIALLPQYVSKELTWGTGTYPKMKSNMMDVIDGCGSFSGSTQGGRMSGGHVTAGRENTLYLVVYAPGSAWDLATQTVLAKSHIACPVQAVQEQVDRQTKKQQNAALEPIFSAGSDEDADDLSSTATTLMAGVPSADEQAAGFEAVMSSSSEEPDLTKPEGDLREFERWVREWGADRFGGEGEGGGIIGGEGGQGKEGSSGHVSGGGVQGSGNRGRKRATLQAPDIGGTRGGSVCGGGVFYDFVAQAVLHVDSTKPLGA